MAVRFTLLVVAVGAGHPGQSSSNGAVVEEPPQLARHPATFTTFCDEGSTEDGTCWCKGGSATAAIGDGSWLWHELVGRACPPQPDDRCDCHACGGSTNDCPHEGCWQCEGINAPQCNPDDGLKRCEVTVHGTHGAEKYYVSHARNALHPCHHTSIASRAPHARAARSSRSRPRRSSGSVVSRSCGTRRSRRSAPASTRAIAARTPSCSAAPPGRPSPSTCVGRRGVMCLSDRAPRRRATSRSLATHVRTRAVMGGRARTMTRRRRREAMVDVIRRSQMTRMRVRVCRALNTPHPPRPRASSHLDTHASTYACLSHATCPRRCLGGHEEYSSLVFFLLTRTCGHDDPNADTQIQHTNHAHAPVHHAVHAHPPSLDLRTCMPRAICLLPHASCAPPSHAAATRLSHLRGLVRSKLGQGPLQVLQVPRLRGPRRQVRGHQR